MDYLGDCNFLLQADYFLGLLPLLLNVSYTHTHTYTHTHCIHIYVSSFNIPHNDQFSLVTQLCPTFCDPMDCSTPGLPVHHQLPGFTQTHIH